MIRINLKLLEEVSEKAGLSERKRANHNFHRHPGDRLQRMLNAIEPGSYIQPHKHDTPDKREAFFILKGRMVVVTWDDEGNIQDHCVLDQETGSYGVEVPARTYHSIISLERGSVAYEVKDGPYDPSKDKKFASWAPDESNKDAAKFNRTVLKDLNLS